MIGKDKMLLDKYEIIKKLGVGAFGTVMLVKDEEGNQIALKQIHKAGAQEALQYIYQEVQIMKGLESEYIVRFIDWEETEEFVYILLEYCEGGDLRRDMTQKPGGIYNLQQAIDIASDVIRGLQIVHSNRIIHRDIKMDNILVHLDKNNKKKYKIADFGLSKPQSTGETVLGTGQYMSPELFLQDSYGFQVDMWAFGVLLYFLLNRQFPFKINPFSDDLEDKYKYLSNQAKEFSYTKAVNNSKHKKTANCNEDMEDLFKRMFQLNQDKRISFPNIRRHPVFSKNFPDAMTAESKMIYKNNMKVTGVEDILDMIMKKGLAVNAVKQPFTPGFTPGRRKKSQINADLRRSFELPLDIKFPKQKQLIAHKNDEINFLHQNFIQFKDVHGVFTLIQKMPLVYNLVKYYLILKIKFIASLKSGQFARQNPNFKIKDYAKTQPFKKLLNDIQNEVSVAKQQYEILHDQCLDCIGEIKNINPQFPDNFNKPLQDTNFQQGAFKLSYRKSTLYAYNKLKKIIQNSKETGNKLNYLMAVSVICHVFNRFFQEKQHYEHVFMKYGKEKELDWNSVNFGKLREWMAKAPPEELNGISKKIIDLYLHK